MAGPPAGPGRDHAQDQVALLAEWRAIESGPLGAAEAVARFKTACACAILLSVIVTTSFVPGTPVPASCRPSSLAIPPAPEPTIVSVQRFPAWGFFAALSVTWSVAAS